MSSKAVERAKERVDIGTGEGEGGNRRHARVAGNRGLLHAGVNW
jgi:hypothetical protein